MEASDSPSIEELQARITRLQGYISWFRITMLVVLLLNLLAGGYSIHLNNETIRIQKSFHIIGPCGPHPKAGVACWITPGESQT